MATGQAPGAVFAEARATAPGVRARDTIRARQMVCGQDRTEGAWPVAKRLNCERLSLLRWQGFGFEVERTVRPIPGTKHTRDHFNVADLECFDDDRVVWVQATSRSNVSARVRKITGDDRLAAIVLRWVRAPGRFFVVEGWTKDNRVRTVRLEAGDDGLVAVDVIARAA